MRRPRPGRRSIALIAAAGVGLSGASLVCLGLAMDKPVAAAAVLPPESPAVSAAPTAAPEAVEAAAPAPVARYTPASEVHVHIPAVGLDLPVLPLTPDDGVINPPLLTAAYFLEPYGHPVGAADQADNTIYLAAHSAGRGDDGFDPLLTHEHRDSALAAGDVVQINTPQGTASYAVERTERVAKDGLPSAGDVWAAAPGRLVLITCFQHRGRATENLVVFAHAVP